MKSLIQKLIEQTTKIEAYKNVDNWNKLNPNYLIRYPITKKEIYDCAYEFGYYVEEMLDYGADEFGYISNEEYIKYSLYE